MIIAIGCEGNQVFGHFGRTPEFAIFEVEAGKVKSKTVVSTGEASHGALAGFLRDHGVDLLICGGIGSGAQQALVAEGIKLFGGVSGYVEPVMNAYLAGTLEANPDFSCHEHEHGEGHSCGCGKH